MSVLCEHNIQIISDIKTLDSYSTTLFMLQSRGSDFSLLSSDKIPDINFCPTSETIRLGELPRA